MTAGRWSCWLCLAALGGLLATEAGAQGIGRPARGRGMEGGRPPHVQPGSQYQALQPPQGDDTARRGGRLTPEERRQLRRDVHQAGRDLYPERPSPGRRPPER